MIITKRKCKECPECIKDSGTSCFWEIEEFVPEKFKPSEIKAYMSVESINGIGFLKATEMGQDFDTEFLSWFVSFCVGKGINAFWTTKGIPFCLGSGIFVEAALRANNANML